MKREQLAFLAGGFLFGILFGFGLFHAIDNRPDLSGAGAEPAGELPSPQGPMAPTQGGPPPGGAGPGPMGGGGAPMVAEVNRLKRLVVEDPQNLEALVRLAHLYHDAAMWDQAAGYYERALTVRPDQPDLLTDLGTCYRDMRQFDRALEQFKRAIEVQPGHWQALYNTVIVAAFDIGRFDLAMDALRSLEAIEPRPAELTARLTQLRAKLEELHQASQPPQGQS